MRLNLHEEPLKGAIYLMELLFLSASGLLELVILLQDS